jgi:hypothetical protein
MTLQELNHIIGRTLAMCKRATGLRREHLRRAMKYLNEARVWLSCGFTSEAKLMAVRAHVRVQWALRA